MKEFLNVIKYISPYWLKASLNVIFNILSAFFALFSFTLAAPFLGILFETLSPVYEKIPFELTKEAIGNNANYLLTQLIENHGKAQALLLVCIGVIVVVFFKSGFRYLANHFLAPIRTNVEKDIRTSIFDKILRLPLSYYTEARKGDVLTRISNDVKEVELSIVSSLEVIFRDPATIIIFLASLFLMNFQLTLVGVILLPIAGLVIGRLGKQLKMTSFRGQEKMGFLLSVIEETISGLRIIKAFNAEPHFSGRFEKVNYTYSRLQKRVQRRRYLAPPMSEFLGTVVMMTIMYYGGKIVLGGTGDLSSELFITYIIVFSQIINPAKSFSNAYFNIQKGLASMDRIRTILDAEETIIEKEHSKPIRDFSSSIEFENVSFKYNTEPVLRHINLKIEKGKTIALVGQSGGGKSTLVDLIPRFIDPNEGTVKIDGVSLDDYKIKDLRDLMGIVSQEPILFNDTFFNNISIGISATEEEIQKAAKVANAHDFIMETPENYYNNIGERGSKLSGGQRQRISIARALLKNPPILILDEATSSLDTESERLVQDAIQKLMENRTSIVIAHRLSTIQGADEICVVHEGEIVERGKHKDLLDIKGYYYKLHKMQMKA